LQSVRIKEENLLSKIDCKIIDLTLMPWPSSYIWRKSKPLFCEIMLIYVEPASIEFSIISFKAAEGQTTISPAAKKSEDY
jgi:hypothetical protein